MTIAKSVQRAVRHAKYAGTKEAMMKMIVNYTVKLENNSIQYIADNECFECGYVDNDKSFFYVHHGKLYCSLHIPEGEDNA